MESVRQDVLLPWTDFIWKPDEKAEPTQGVKGKQRDLMDNFLVEKPRPKTGALSPSKTKHVPANAAAIPPQPSDSSPVSPPSSSETLHYAAHDSNPNAQRAMANPSWRAAHTSMAPDFIEGYYKNSRLHYLSTWKAELRGLVAEAIARAERGEGESSSDTWKTHGDDGGGVSMLGAELTLRSPSKGKAKAKTTESSRIIMHCDFDCFFVSAGLVSRPHLRGKPVVVCHSQGSTGGGASTSEIASSSYEAREFGIKNGMRCGDCVHSVVLYQIHEVETVYSRRESCVLILSQFPMSLSSKWREMDSETFWTAHALIDTSGAPLSSTPSL
jgi:DNA repair protein REV1